jgi:hypothetical protein
MSFPAVAVAHLHAGLDERSPNRIGVAPKLPGDASQGLISGVQRGGLSDLARGEGTAAARNAPPFQQGRRGLSADAESVG